MLAGPHLYKFAALGQQELQLALEKLKELNVQDLQHVLTLSTEKLQELASCTDINALVTVSQQQLALLSSKLTGLSQEDLSKFMSMVICQSSVQISHG